LNFGKLAKTPKGREFIDFTTGFESEVKFSHRKLVEDTGNSERSVSNKKV
jgi:hypothetical protein